jgi:DNA topoisomerase I
MADAKAPARGRLRRSDAAGAGINRRKRGRSFSFEDAEGTSITDEETLRRIRDLTIPPAWKEVWICPDPNGHIQATGYDGAGRKQYRYHDRWDERRANRKYAAMREFAAVLPRLRRAVRRDIELEGMPRERALATAVRLLDLGFFRIGSEEYAQTNESYGLATIRRRRGGSEDLLAWKECRRWRDVRSGDINDYIQDTIGTEFSAKDFRTWSGTVLAAAALAGEEKPASDSAAKRTINRGSGSSTRSSS